MHNPGATCAAAIAVALLWSATVGGDRQTKPGPPAPEAPFEILWLRPLPVLDDGKLAPRLVVGDSFVFVANPESGLTAHALDDGHTAWSSTLVPSLGPVIAGARIAIAADGVLHVLNQQTGETDWRSELEPGTTAILAFGDRLAAVAGAGMRTWETGGAPAWRTPLGGTPVTPVVFRNERFYAGLDEPSIVAIDSATGAVRWRVRLPAQPLSLAAADDRLYLSAADATLYSYRTSGDRDPSWKFHLVGSIGQPAVDDRQVYFALLDNTLRAFERKGGTQRWSRVLPSRPLTGPVQVGASLAIALTTGQVVVLSPMDGRIRASATPAAPLPALRLQAGAVARDGSRFYTVTIAKDYSRTLTAWGRK